MACILKEEPTVDKNKYKKLKLSNDQYNIPFFSTYRESHIYSGSEWMTVKSYVVNEKTIYYINQKTPPPKQDGDNTDRYNLIFVPHLWNFYDGINPFGSKGVLNIYIFDKTNNVFKQININNYNADKTYSVHDDGDVNSHVISDSIEIPVKNLIGNKKRLHISFNWEGKSEIFYGIYDFQDANWVWNQATDNKGNIDFELSSYISDTSVVTTTNDSEICKTMTEFLTYINLGTQPSSRTSIQYKSKDLTKLCDAITIADSKTDKDAIITKIIEIINSQENGTELNQVVCENRNTLLHLASSKGYVGVVEALLNKDVDINKTNGLTETSLELAIEKNKVEVVKLLLERGAQTTVPEGVWTPLHQASSRGHVEIVKLLLKKGADINAKNNEGKTAIEVTKSEEIKKILAPPGGGGLLTSKSSPVLLTTSLLNPPGSKTLPKSPSSIGTSTKPVESSIGTSAQHVYDPSTKPVDNPSAKPVDDPSAQPVENPSNKTSTQSDVNISTTHPRYIEVIFKDNIPQTVVIIDKPLSEPPTLSAYIETMSFNNTGKVILQLSDEDMKYILNPIEIMKMPVQEAK